MGKAKAIDADALLVQSSREVRQLVPTARFEELKFWDKLSEKEQQIVKEESHQLVQAMILHGGSKLAMGEHFLKLRDVLEPRRCFQKYVKAATRLPLRTVLRYITAYENASTRLPEVVLRAAMARGMNMLGEREEEPLGKYSRAVEIMPPPRSPDADQANRYLDQVETWNRERRSIIEKGKKKGKSMVDELVKPGDPDKLLRKSYRAFEMFFKRLPNDRRTRRHFIEKLVGMMLADLGVANSQTFEPTAIPEGFKAVRGRPKEKETDLALVQ
jgi:hypothetical protein